MSADTLVALAIVAGAVAFLVRRAVRQARARKAGGHGGAGCDRCAH